MWSIEDMASQFTARLAPIAFMGYLPFHNAPRPDKLDRLRELRATIDGLRSEREGQDPLLRWITSREDAQIS